MNAAQTSTNFRGNGDARKARVVLLVEDETVVREITGQVLQHAGYSVLESGTANEALTLATEHAGKIDLLLTDVVMPGMNGIELASRLIDLQPGLITVFMSGYAESDLMRSMRVAPAMHIQKPFTMNSLLRRIAEALNPVVTSGHEVSACAS